MAAMAQAKAYTVGIDFGTNSVRCVIVDCMTGEHVGAGVATYPSGEDGVLLNPARPHQARQHPADYLWGLEACVAQAVREAQRREGFIVSRVMAIGVDATGSSPLPVDGRNRPLALTPEFEKHPDAQCWLWKDHTAHREAEEITRLAAAHRPHYLKRCGGIYSSEWFWAKILHCLRQSPEVFAAAESWVELADYIPAVLTGAESPEMVRRGICCAGHKALYAEEWGGLPDKEFLSLLAPELAAFRDRLYGKAWDASVPAGALSADWGGRLGLPCGIPVAIGAMDVHYGAIGAGIEEGTLVKVIGTSSCDCAVLPASQPIPEIPGICGIVKGSILPDCYGVEAGQSAVGDIFKWWVEKICEGDASLHLALSEEAGRLHPGESGLLALDWNNGNRTVLVDQLLTGLLVGQTLYTTRAEIYRALIEATAFGAYTIIGRLRSRGVKVDQIVCAGGIAEKNPLLLQIYADITGCRIFLAGSGQACALGAAIAGAILAGVHTDWDAGRKAMTSRKPTCYEPIPAHQEVYERLYHLYRQLHDAFGVSGTADLAPVMKQLIRIREETRSKLQYQ